MKKIKHNELSLADALFFIFLMSMGIALAGFAMALSVKCMFWLFDFFGL